MLNQQRIDEMKERVFEANQALPQLGLVKLTWGNVSEIDRELGIIVIKPSGVDYAEMKKEQMVVTDLKGNILEEKSLRPSSDLATHIVLYEKMAGIHSIVHTHSTHAVMWAQAGREVPAYGTTHADTFYGSIPCTRQLTEKEVQEAYEVHTGKVIVETFLKEKKEAVDVPGVLVFGHGPFTWGETAKKAVQNSLVLEEVCKMARQTEELNAKVEPIPQYLLDKHYYRKHGKNAYYGQK